MKEETEVGTECVWHGEMKGSVESTKYSHTREGVQICVFMWQIYVISKIGFVLISSCHVF